MSYRLRMGDLVKQAREARGLTQEAAAEELGVNRGTFRYWEIGAQVPQLDHLVRIAAWVGVSLAELLRRAGVGVEQARPCPTCTGTGVVEGGD